MEARKAKIWVAFFVGSFLLCVASWQCRQSLHDAVRSASLPKVEAPAAGTIRFAVVGDYGTGNDNEGDVALLIESWRPEFIATVGDNNYPAGAAQTIDRNIGRFFHAYISPYTGNYGSGAKTNRFFPIPGHRDWDSSTKLQPYLDYFTLPGNERYYQFVWGPVHLFMLDTDEREPDGATTDSVQARWLKAQLANSKAAWKIVLAHHAPYTSHTVPDVDRMRWPFKAWGADAVLSGYYHVYERLIVDGIPYFVNGVGGASLSGFGEIDPRSKFRVAGSYGAMLVDATAKQMTFRFVNRDGRVIDEYELQSLCFECPASASS